MIDDDTFDALSPGEALEGIGVMIDEAADTRDEILNDRALELCQRLHSRASLGRGRPNRRISLKASSLPCDKRRRETGKHPALLRPRSALTSTQDLAAAKKPKFKPTDEQQVALEAFLSGRSLKINASADTGKTSTLQLLANATAARGQYIAFNKDIVTDSADKFPDTVDCSTSHRLAFRAVTSGYKQSTEKLTSRCTANHLVEALEKPSVKMPQPAPSTPPPPPSRQRRGLLGWLFGK